MDFLVFSVRVSHFYGRTLWNCRPLLPSYCCNIIGNKEKSSVKQRGKNRALVDSPMQAGEYAMPKMEEGGMH